MYTREPVNSGQPWGPKERVLFTSNLYTRLNCVLETPWEL